VKKGSSSSSSENKSGGREEDEDEDELTLDGLPVISLRIVGHMSL